MEAALDIFVACAFDKVLAACLPYVPSAFSVLCHCIPVLATALGFTGNNIIMVVGYLVAWYFA